jgi:hypothetical protein
VDPDSGGLKRAKLWGTNPAKRRLPVGIKSIKINVIGIKMFIVICDIIFLKI